MSSTSIAPLLEAHGGTVALGSQRAFPATPGCDAIRTAKIAIVDDEPINIKLVRKYLSVAGFENFITVTDSVTVMELLPNEEPDVLLLDIMMPKVSGLEVLQRVRANRKTALLPVIILTAADDDRTKIQALDLGATDFLAKPVNAVELVPRVRNALIMHAHQKQLQSHAEELDRQVRRRTAELAASRLELIHCLARAAEFRDNETGLHVIRVGRYAGVVARHYGLDEATCELIEQTAPLHDMGKIGVPDSILLKPDRLTPEEFELIQRHTTRGKRTFEPMSMDEWRSLERHTLMGEKILEAGNSPLLAMAGRIALTHHEKWDGSGYPLGLSGEQIPLEGRITAVADVFDALSSRRPYKPAFPLDECFRIMEKGRGGHFDPRVLDAFFAGKEEVIAIRVQFTDLE
jgi:putative two-component system response regulator